ncbi:unnamed protein product, partial [Laminaria digitata]
HQAYKDHENFDKSRFATKLEFTVNHYAGSVVYNTGGFVEKNRDQLQSDLVKMLSTSKNGVLGDCFGNNGSRASPDDDPAGNGRQRKGSLMQASTESLGSKFKRQLHSLMAAIQRTEVQYVRCIKPNANKSKDELDSSMVVEQLRCAGVVEAIRISRAAYPNRMIFKDFSQRFLVLANSSKRGIAKSRGKEKDAASFAKRSPSSQCKHILDRLLGSKKDAKCCLGNTKVYFRAGVLEQLEEARGKFVRVKVVTVQRVLMGNAKRRPYLRLRNAAVIVQKMFRGARGRLVAKRARAEKVERERREKERRDKEEEEKRMIALKKADDERRRKEEEDKKKVGLQAPKKGGAGGSLMGKFISGGGKKDRSA